MVVTAEDGVTTKTYTVTVTRAEPSGDATLSDLELTGVSAADLGFQSDDIDYDVEVGNGVTSTTHGHDLRRERQLCGAARRCHRRRPHE